MNPDEKPLFQLNGVKLSTPPLGARARREAGFLLGKVQSGEVLGMPQARALPGIAAGLYELRVREADKNWRIFYRVDDDYIVIVHQLKQDHAHVAKSGYNTHPEPSGDLRCRQN